MAEEMPTTTPVTTDSPKKKGLPTIAIVGIGCLVVLVILGIIFSIIGRLFAKKIGTSMVQNVIEKNTGVKTNLSDIEKGTMSFTDTKTGEKVDVGTNKIPDTFPKDFPIYPGAKVTSSLSGNQSGKNNGFWLTLMTADALNKVTSFYTSNLKTNGWTVTTTLEVSDGMTLGVSKGKTEGSLTVNRASSAKETVIVVVLGQTSVTATPTVLTSPDATSTPGE